MNLHIWQGATHMAQAVFASAQSNVQPEAAGTPDPCALSHGLTAFFKNIVIQTKNAVPEFVYIAFFVLGVATLLLAFTGKLGKVGGMFVGVVIGVMLIGLAGTLSNIFAPSSC